MESTDIQRIEQLAVAAHEIGHNTDIPVVALPPGSAIHSLELYLDKPARMRAKFSTPRIVDFCKYVERHAKSTDDDTAVFIDPDGGSAIAVLDYGDTEKPGWKQHKAVLKLQASPEARAIEQIVGKELSQRALIEWLEDWHDEATPLIGDIESTIEKAVQAIRKVSIKTSGETTSEERNFGATKGTMATIDAVSGNGDLPTHIIMPCEVYIGTKVRDVTIALSLLTGGSEPKFKARIVGRDALMRDVAEEVEDTIKNDLKDVGTMLDVHIGSIE